MATLWTDSLSTGVDKIDNQHKTLFEKADQLFQSGKKGDAKEQVGRMLQFLDDYTKLHFMDEEKLMLEHRYPEYEAQRRMHAAFIDSLSKLKTEYESSGGNIAVIINANQMVLNWLVDHISKQDKKIGVYIRTLKK